LQAGPLPVVAALEEYSGGIYNAFEYINMQDEEPMSTTAEVYALAYCARFDIDRMQRQRDDTHRSVICRNVLHETWRSGEVFIFDYGVLVFWRLDVEARSEYIRDIRSFASEPMPMEVDDQFTFAHGLDKPFIKNDHIHLDNEAVMTRLAVSHGIAQSTKLAQFELHVQNTINDTAHIPRKIAETGSSRLSRKELAKLRGRLFLVSSDVMLNYDLLDVPDFFWEYPELQVYYSMLSDYLEVRQRVEVLSKKLETIHGLFEMMADEQKHKHSSLLEWIIIWLIFIEIVMFLVQDFING